MTTPSDSTVRSANGTAPSRDQLEADIEATRAQLGDTVDALAQRLDVKARVKTRAADTTAAARAKALEAKSRATAQAQGNPALPIGAAVVALIVVGTVVWRRRS